jgi:hypothetical protein
MMREGALERPIAGREGGRICSDLPRSAVAGRQARRLALLFVLKIAVYRRVFVRSYRTLALGRFVIRGRVRREAVSLLSGFGSPLGLLDKGIRGCKKYHDAA